MNLYTCTKLGYDNQSNWNVLAARQTKNSISAETEIDIIQDLEELAVELCECTRKVIRNLKHSLERLYG